MRWLIHIARAGLAANESQKRNYWPEPHISNAIASCAEFLYWIVRRDQTPAPR